MTIEARAARLACVLLVAVSARLGAQTLPSEPIVFGDGLLTLSGDVSATYGSEDRGWFNYTDYNHSALRLFRVDVTGSVRAGDHFSILGELRSENVGRPTPYGLYLRIRPWTSRRFYVQAGRVPPTFGGFARRTYAPDNPLIGYPLAYQYLTTVRPDSLPASADELLSRRGLGWLTRFSIGSQVRDHGMPLVTAFKWDTGVQFHGENDWVGGTLSVTAGTVSNPRFTDDNNGPQIAGRVDLQPVAGLKVGASVARGPFVTRSAASAAGDAEEGKLTQTAWGGDLEYSRGYYLVRFETIVSDWRLPVVLEPRLVLPLRAVSTSVEGRYKIAPGLYAAARLDHLGFSTLTTPQTTAPWDAPVSRIEVGGGYSIQRNLLLKLSFQHNTRNGGPLIRSANLLASQAVFWF